MTKHDEIALLDSTIKAFGPHSYLGPWLLAHRDILESQIVSDLAPDIMMPAQAVNQAREIRVAALAEAVAIMEQARADAKKLEDVAHARAADARQALRAAIARIAKSAEYMS
jgi:hypothetical protein